MKNHDLIVARLVDALFEDLASASPLSASSRVHSYKILYEALSSRGLPFLTITLPECSKFLQRCIELGSLDNERPPYHGALRHNDIRPRFLHGLWSNVFDADGQLLAEPDHASVFWLRQVYNLFKKLELECDPAYVEQELNSFSRIESELPPSHPGTWDSDNPKWSPRLGHPLWGSHIKIPRQELLDLGTTVDLLSLPWHRFHRICAEIAVTLGFVDIWAIRPKHGPGAVSERGSTVKWEFRTWPRKLETIFPADYFASYDMTNRSISDKELPARMCVVPKTQKGPRLIACEPSAHQWIQGGLQRWLEDRVSSSFLGLSIDFRNQEYSRALALEASKTKAFATVDLSAASDRLTTRLVEYVFGANHSLLDALHACRSRSMIMPSGLIKGKETSDQLFLLRKFAPMGSACTFPIQTIVFTAISHFAICLAREDWDMTPEGFRNRATSIRVFGDDIIIDTDAASHLVRILHECGLKVNQDKSFFNGLFREACGMDAFDGVDVTPGYIRKLYQPLDPESLVSTVDCSNNLHQKGLWHVADELLKTVPPEELQAIQVAHKGFGPLSLFTYVQGLPTATRKRWNRNLHRHEYRILTITGRVKYLEGSGEASVLQYLMEEPDPSLPWQAGTADATRLKKKVAWVSPY